MPREELTPQARAQLDALDRILARDPVGEEHLELAALVESVRANAPAMDPAFAERLDAQVHARPARSLRLPARSRRPPRVAPRRLALAGGGLVTAAVALAIVLSSGLLKGATQVPGVRTHPGSASFAAHSPSRREPGVAAGPKAFSGVAAPAHAAPTNAAPTRLVQRSSTLVLASPVAQLQRVADAVIARTERAGGVVASSYVDVAGTASAASFTLHVPGTRMPSLLASLSALASVRSLTQATVDITGPYDSALATIATLEAQRATLQHELASAPTSAAATAIGHRLHAVEADIAAQRAAAAALLEQGRTATLHVRLGVATVGAHHVGAAAAGGGTLGRAAHQALAALEDMLAVALVALAIALPVALSVLVVWWLWAALRQRARERVIAAS